MSGRKHRQHSGKPKSKPAWKYHKYGKADQREGQRKRDRNLGMRSW